MEDTRSLLDQLEELANDVIALSNRLTCTAEDVRFAQSFHPQSIVAELMASRKIMLDLSARLAEMGKVFVPDGKPASETLRQNQPTMRPYDAVSLRPASSEDIPATSLGLKWEDAEARLSGLTQLIEGALQAENASDAAMNLDDLALQYHRRKKFDEAERLYQHALAFREKFFGPCHASVATSLNNLAVLLQEQGRHEEAVALLRRSSSIPTKTWIPDHPEPAQRQPNLESLCLKEENVNDVELLFEQVLETVEKQQPVTLSETKASLNPEALEGEVTTQECEKKAKADLYPEAETTIAEQNRTDEQDAGTHTEHTGKGSENETAEADVSSFPTVPFVILEPVQRRKPAVPAWTWNVAAMVALSICVLFIWEVTSRPVPVEIHKDAPTKPSSDLMSSPTTGTLKFPDLLPGTRVSVDGVPHNLAPDSSFETTLSEGDHNIELTRPGYEPKSLSVELRAGQTVTIRGKEVTVDNQITGN